MTLEEFYGIRPGDRIQPISEDERSGRAAEVVRSMKGYLEIVLPTWGNVWVSRMGALVNYRIWVGEEANRQTGEFYSAGFTGKNRT